MPNNEQAIILQDLFDEQALLTSREWQPLREGVNISMIYDSGNSGPRAAFLHYSPGASVPMHEHFGFEHILILHGSQIDGENVYKKGMLVIHKKGSLHQIHSPEGCVALGIWQEPVGFIKGE